MPKEAKGKNLVTLVADTIVINNFVVISYPIGQEQLIVKYSTGSMDADGNFTPVATRRVHLTTEQLMPIMGKLGDPSKTLYESLQEELYAIVDADS